MSSDQLSPELLLSAYSQGCFPMPDPESGEILWFRPDPRAVIPLDGFHVSRSLKKSLRNRGFQITYDQAFSEVMHACAARVETWITPGFIDAYSELFSLGFAHSAEVWHSGSLVGGTYGVSIGGGFFAESMFHSMTDASKVALYCLTKKLKSGGFILLECQFLTSHLQSLGAIEMAGREYLQLLSTALNVKTIFLPDTLHTPVHSI